MKAALIIQKVESEPKPLTEFHIWDLTELKQRHYRRKTFCSHQLMISGTHAGQTAETRKQEEAAVLIS